MNLGNSDYATLDSDHDENSFTAQRQKVEAILRNAFIKGELTEEQRIYYLSKYNLLLLRYNKTRQITQQLRKLHQRGDEILKSIKLDQKPCDNGSTPSIPHANNVIQHSENAQVELAHSLEDKIKLLACYKKLRCYHDSHEKYSKTIKNLTTQRDFLIEEVKKLRAKRASVGSVRSEEKTQLTPQESDIKQQEGESKLETICSEDGAVRTTNDLLVGSDASNTEVYEETGDTTQLIPNFDESVIHRQKKIEKLEQNVTFIRHRVAWYKDVVMSTIEAVQMAKDTLQKTKDEVHKLRCQRNEMTQRLTDAFTYFRNAQKAILEYRNKITTLNGLVQKAKEEAFQHASQRLRVSEKVDRLKQKLLNNALPSSATSGLLKYIFELHETQAKTWAMRIQLQEVLQQTGDLIALVDNRAAVHQSLATRQQQLNDEVRVLNYRQLCLQTWVAVCKRTYDNCVLQQAQKAAKWKERFCVLKAKLDYLRETKEQQEREYKRLKERRQSAAEKCRALQSKLATLSQLMKKSESKGSTVASEILSQSQRSFTIRNYESMLQPYVQLDYLTGLCTELELVTHREAGFELLFKTTFRFRSVGDENNSDVNPEKLHEKLSILERRVYQKEARIIELRLIYEYVLYITVKLKNESAHHKKVGQSTIRAKNRVYNKLQTLSRRTKMIESEITVVKAKANRLWQELQTRHEELKLVSMQLEQDRKKAGKKQRETMKNLSNPLSVHQSEDSPQHKFYTQSIKVFRACNKPRKRKGVKYSKPFV